jgi:hypothetical protein
MSAPDARSGSLIVKPDNLGFSGFPIRDEGSDSPFSSRQSCAAPFRDRIGALLQHTGYQGTYIDDVQKGRRNGGACAMPWRTC